MYVIKLITKYFIKNKINRELESRFHDDFYTDLNNIYSYARGYTVKMNREFIFSLPHYIMNINGKQSLDYFEDKIYIGHLGMV
jgi:hypothetical protein